MIDKDNKQPDTNKPKTSYRLLFLGLLLLMMLAWYYLEK